MGHKPIVPERSFEPNHTLKQKCAGCPAIIPIINLIKIHPTSRKRYCWHCASKIRNGLTNGKPYLKPEKDEDRLDINPR